MASSATSQPRVELPRTVSAEAIFEANDLAHAFFLGRLSDADAEHVRTHLTVQRALPEAIIEADGYGFLPETRDAMVRLAVQHGTSLEVFAEAGLLYRSSGRARRMFQKARGREANSTEELSAFFLERLQNKPEFYFDYPLCVLADDSRQSGNWLTIPIRVLDDAGQIRIGGFQYRSMRGAEEIGKRGRYMSPVNSQVLSWASTLIGLAEEREQIGRSGRVVLCEGKFDQASIRAGLLGTPEQERPGVVAMGGVSVRGTTHTDDDPVKQAGVLGMLGAKHVTFLLDGDAPGAEAVLRAGPLLARLGVTVVVARVSDGLRRPDPTIKDPGDLYAKHGGAAIRLALDAGQNRGLVTYASEEVSSRLRQDPRAGQLRRRLEALDQLLPMLDVLPDAVKDRARQRVAETVGLSPSVVAIASGAEVPAAPTQEPRQPRRGRTTPA